MWVATVCAMGERQMSMDADMQGRDLQAQEQQESKEDKAVVQQIAALTQAVQQIAQAMGIRVQA